MMTKSRDAWRIDIEIESRGDRIESRIWTIVFLEIQKYRHRVGTLMCLVY